MKNPASLLYELETQMTPTRASNKDEVILQSSHGDIIFEGAIIDVPGGSPQDVLRTITNPTMKNKILLLVLAHTKAYEGSEIDHDLIQEQLTDVQKLWVTTIQAYGTQLNKIVILINKIDLLPQEYLPAQKHIYEEHIKLLYNAAKSANISISAVEGSSITGTNLGELYQELRPIST